MYPKQCVVSMCSMTTNAPDQTLSRKRGWTPIAWMEAGIRLTALAILLTAGLLNARPEDSPGHAHIERAMARLQQARSALIEIPPASPIPPFG